MQSQRETRDHYQNLIEHQYLFRFESIPLDSSLPDKDDIPIIYLS